MQVLILVLYCGVGLLFLAVGAGNHTLFAGQAYVMVVANLATIACFLIMAVYVVAIAL